MTILEKVEMTLAMLGETDSTLARKVETYLIAAGKEILAWRYSYSRDAVEDVPAEYEMTQIHAVIAGYSLSGAENQTYHSRTA